MDQPFTLKIPRFLGPTAVETVDKAVHLFEQKRDEGVGWRASEFEDGQIYNSTGKQIGRISYNGRVWSIDGHLLREVHL